MTIHRDKLRKAYGGQAELSEAMSNRSKGHRGKRSLSDDEEAYIKSIGYALTIPELRAMVIERYGKTVSAATVIRARNR